MTGASAAGLLFPAALYPAQALRQSFVTNDVVNLVIGLPFLLGTPALARRGRLAGLLFWPGALAGLGGLFFLRAAGLLGTALVNRTPLPAAELGVSVADLLVTPIWIIGGVALWRKRPRSVMTGLSESPEDGQSNEQREEAHDGQPPADLEKVLKLIIGRRDHQDVDRVCKG